jgi:hypothetical protein
MFQRGYTYCIFSLRIFIFILLLGPSIFLRELSVKTFFIIPFILVSFSTYSIGKAQNQTIFIFDSSGSMGGEVKGQIKLDLATNVLGELLTSWEKRPYPGLIVYGHKNGDCSDIDFIHPIDQSSPQDIKASLKSFRPIGKTPLGDSLLLASKGLESNPNKTTIIMLSDGEETCGKDPCKIAKEIKAKGINLKVHLVGFDIQNENGRKQLECIANSTGGKYFPAADSKQLKEVLNEAITLSKKKSTLISISFKGLDKKKRVSVNYSWIDKNGKVLSKSNSRYTSASIGVDTPGEYTLEVERLGVKSLHNYTVSEGQYLKEDLVLSFDTVSLDVSYNNKPHYADIKVFQLNQESSKPVFHKTFYGRHKIEMELPRAKYQVIVEYRGGVFLAKEISINSDIQNHYTFELAGGFVVSEKTDVRDWKFKLNKSDKKSHNFYSRDLKEGKGLFLPEGSYTFIARYTSEARKKYNKNEFTGSFTLKTYETKQLP